jgi:hypothetical protein
MPERWENAAVHDKHSEHGEETDLDAPEWNQPHALHRPAEQELRAAG